jgi:hypothetical protein
MRRKWARCGLIFRCFCWPGRSLAMAALRRRSNREFKCRDSQTVVREVSSGPRGGLKRRKKNPIFHSGVKSLFSHLTYVVSTPCWVVSGKSWNSKVVLGLRKFGNSWFNAQISTFSRALFITIDLTSMKWYRICVSCRLFQTAITSVLSKHWHATLHCFNDPLASDAYKMLPVPA